MKTRIGRTALPIALMILVTCSLWASAEETSLEIGPRSLPASADVSEPIREALMKTPTLDVSAAKGTRFKTDAEWEAWANGNRRTSKCPGRMPHGP